ncbi:MAG: hypothetical protein K0U93_04775 [Gammaproteobacteria bacterium]|nr:hypothetical protein [Gammaproteobacteria bacterium]
MSTTNLFVELLVIGLGVFVWLMLLALAIIGVDQLALNDKVLFASALPVLAFTYVLGIVWDRIADKLFDRIWSDGLRRMHFQDKSSYYDARRIILTRSPALSALLEYGRSRLRICRAWTLNALMMCIALNAFLFGGANNVADPGLASAIGSSVTLALALGSWFAWNNLSQAEYRKVSEQGKYLAQLSETEQVTPTAGR